MALTTPSPSICVSTSRQIYESGKLPSQAAPWTAPNDVCTWSYTTMDVHCKERLMSLFYTVWTRQCDVFSIQTILWRLEHSDDCFPKQESCCFTSASCEKDATKDELRSISLHTLRLCQQITDVKRGTLMSCDQPWHVAKVSKQTTTTMMFRCYKNASKCLMMFHPASWIPWWTWANKLRSLISGPGGCP